MTSILVAGAGAVGQFLAREWHAAGRDVTLVARYGTADRLERARFPIIRLTRNQPTGDLRRKWTIVVLAVRGYELPALLPVVKDLASSSAAVLVTARDRAAYATAEQVFHSRTFSAILEGAIVKGPTDRLEILARPARLEIGHEATRDWLRCCQLDAVARILDFAALPCVAAPDCAVRRGTVLMQSLLTESIAMLLRVPPAVALGDPQCAPLLGQLVNELSQAAWRAKLRFDAGWAETWTNNVVTGGWLAHARTLNDIREYKTLEVLHLAKAVGAGDIAGASAMGLAVRSAVLYGLDRANRLGLRPQETLAEPRGALMEGRLR
ncbi:MAG: ketopantoate reductase family protein [Steroidobacteraceae bacterium]